MGSLVGCAAATPTRAITAGQGRGRWGVISLPSDSLATAHWRLATLLRFPMAHTHLLPRPRVVGRKSLLQRQLLLGAKRVALFRHAFDFVNLAFFHLQRVPRA